MPRLIIKKILIALFCMLPPHLAHPADDSDALPCSGKKYESARRRLKKVYDEDQNDRKDFDQWTETQIKEVVKRDRIRRIWVAGVFARGCLKSADDYLYAATVFQHGEVPDHFFQTYIWATQAFRLGNSEAGRMAGNGIDRYLMNQGFKQLYGRQAITRKENEDCFCLWPIEETFPDEERKKMGFLPKKDVLEILKEANINRKNCVPSFCKVEAKPVPRSSVPGVW